jgi:hypothetical protein
VLPTTSLVVARRHSTEPQRYLEEFISDPLIVSGGEAQGLPKSAVSG